MTPGTTHRPFPVPARLEMVVAVAIAALAIAWNLDAKWIVGDELNAIHYLRDGFLEYIRTFHYGLPIKVQVWVLHELFGNDFGWYRVPAAVAAILACAFLFTARPALRPSFAPAGLIVVVLLAFNASFQFFARWGMPSFAEAIAAATLFVGLVLRDLRDGPRVRWTAPKVVLACLLPWLYPATIVLLGGVSTYLGLALLPALRHPRDLRALAGKVLHAATPLLLGLVNFGINIGLRSTEDWERARGHHATFSGWVAETGGGWSGFLADGMAGLLADLHTPATGAGASQVFAGGYAAVALLAGLAILAAPVIVLRFRGRHGAITGLASSSRALGLSWTILVSTLVVTSLAGLMDAFPVGSVRYVLHLFPTVAFLAIFSLACVGWAVERAAPRTWAWLAGAIVASMLVLAAFGIRALAADRSATESREGALLSALRSDRNLAVVAWNPGFFLPDALLPPSTAFFHVGARERIPSGLVPLALGGTGPRAPSGESREIAFFTLVGGLVDGSGRLDDAVADFAHRTGYEITGRLAADRHEVIVFTPRPGAATGSRTAHAEFALPPGRIVSIRIEPTELRAAKVTVERLALASADGTRRIDLCADRRLQLVRTVRLRRSRDGCVFSFGNADGSGWIAPTELRNLAGGEASRRLELTVTGELGLRVKVFLDVGRGYGSRDMLAVDVPPVAATSATGDAPDFDANPGNP